MPFSIHVDDRLDKKPLLEAPRKGSAPRRVPQSGGSVKVHPAGTGIQVWWLLVEGKILKSCGGVPMRTMKVDQLPALPSHDRLGGNEKGAGIF